MISNNKLIITESQKNNIRELYGIKPKKDFIFSGYITIDEGYMIIQDHLISIKENKIIGYLWDSIDMFKILFENFKPNNDKSLELKENFLNYPLLENNKNLYDLRDYILNNNLQESIFDNTVNQLKNLASDSINKLKNTGSEFINNLLIKSLKDGVIYFLRRLKDLMFNTTYMVVDSLLGAMMGVTGGITKAIQMLPWASLLGLEIYQWINNDYEGEEPSIGSKIFDISFPLLSLGFGAVLAKGFMSVLKPILKSGKSVEKTAELVAKNPQAKNTLEKILTKTKDIPKYINDAKVAFSKKYPKISQFFSGIVGGISSIIKQINEFIIKITGKSKLAKGVVAGAKTYGTIKAFDAGIEGGVNLYNKYKSKNNANIENTNSEEENNNYITINNIDDIDDSYFNYDNK